MSIAFLIRREILVWSNAVNRHGRDPLSTMIPSREVW